MLIPVNPSRALARSSRRKPDADQRDVHLEVIPPKGGDVKRVGKAKASGRTAVFNRKGP